MHDAACIDAIVKGAVGLEKISGERIHSEMMKVLAHPSVMIELKVRYPSHKSSQFKSSQNRSFCSVLLKSN